jgi:hypothetical protein
MRCVKWGHETPSEKPYEPLGWATLGRDDHEVSCPAYLGDPQLQATPVISTAAWLGQWAGDKTREKRPHHMAKQQERQLRRSRHRNAPTSDSGYCGVAAAEQDGASRGGNLPVKPAEAIALDEGGSYPVDGAMRAEIMEYLSQTYGPVFVAELIKHLSPPGCR